MIDERKVKLMTRMAMYENGKGKEDLEISSYYRKDYISFHRVTTFLWVTLGSGCLFLLIGMCLFDQLLENLSVGFVITLIIGCAITYGALVILYSIASYIICNKKHKNARKRVKRFNHDLLRLQKIYEKERE